MTRHLLFSTLFLAAGLVATPSLADLKEDYMAACMGASGDNTELCTCKTTEAVKLADDEMLGFIILSLKDTAKFQELIGKGEVPEKVTKQWGFYVMKSNAICIPASS